MGKVGTKSKNEKKALKKIKKQLPDYGSQTENGNSPFYISFNESAELGRCWPKLPGLKPSHLGIDKLEIRKWKQYVGRISNLLF